MDRRRGDIPGPDDEPPIPNSQIDWEAVLAYLPIIAAPDFVAGTWVASERRPDGAWSMPYVDLSTTALEFIRTVGSRGVTFVFDYRTWWFNGGRRFVEEPGALDGATLDDIRRLLVTHIRNDRFVEGHLLGAFESGHMVRLLERVATLVN